MQTGRVPGALAHDRGGDTVTVLVVADDVITTLGGPGSLAPLVAGQVGPAAAQCWTCGGGLRIRPGPPGSVSLSAMEAGPNRYLTLFAHIGCCPSRVVTYDEFTASPAKHIPSPVPAEDETVLIDEVHGDGAYPAAADLVCPRCPACDQPPAMLIGGGSQAFCATDGCHVWAWNALEPADSPANTTPHPIDLSTLDPS